MTAAVYNLVIDQGSDFAVQLALAEDGSVKDLTGYSARAQLRLKKTSVEKAADFTCIVTNPSGGVVSMQLNNTITASLAAGIYYYDLELFTAGDTIVTRLLEGQATITQEVTR
jgi:hypothetical protein